MVGSHVEDFANPWCFMRLRDIVQALALDAQAQLALYPDGSAKVDELANDFDHWWICVKGNDGNRLSLVQQSALAAISDSLDKMSSPSNMALWSETALRNSTEWEQISVLAMEALSAFGWPKTVPENFGKPYSGIDS